MGENGVVLRVVTQSAFTIHTETTTAALNTAAAPAAAKVRREQNYQPIGR